MLSAAIVKRVSMLVVGPQQGGLPTGTFWGRTDVGFTLGLGYQMRPQEAVAYLGMDHSYRATQSHSLNGCGSGYPGCGCLRGPCFGSRGFREANRNAPLTVKEIVLPKVVFTSWSRLS